MGCFYRNSMKLVGSASEPIPCVVLAYFVPPLAFVIRQVRIPPSFRQGGRGTGQAKRCNERRGMEVVEKQTDAMLLL